MIEAANVHPDYSTRQRIDAADLPRISDACVVFEHAWRDSDNEPCYAYTVGGWLDGRPLGGMQGGATVGGEVIVVHAVDRGAADQLAGLGLQDTIAAAQQEGAAYIKAQAALARLAAVNPVRRIELATADAANLSTEFVNDTRAIRPLRGDDIVLSTGGVQT
jgi:hypothetical protein